MPPLWDPAIFWVAGVLAGLCWLDESARRANVDRRRTFACGMVVVAAGWLGARVVGIAAYHDPELGLMGGRSWFGGLTGGLAGAILIIRPLRLSLGSWLHSAAEAVCLGYAIGRIGCFINGCDYGALSSLPWAIDYGPGFPAFERHVEMGWIASDAVRSLGVHPVQLYAAAAALVLFFVLRPLPRLRSCVWLGAYGLLRLSLEPLRGDGAPVFAALTQTQIFALGTVGASALLAVLTIARRTVASRHA